MRRAVAIAAVSVLLVLGPALSASAKTMPKPWGHRDRVTVTCPYKTVPYGRFCLPITTSGWVR